MNNRIITFLLAAVSAITVFADKKMTIHNTDADTSLEVSVSEEMKIYEYNADWLDSIPYLTEHARWKEPWAYEALAECYRYGKGGIEKSMFNTLICYDEAGKSAIKIAEDAYESNHFDELGLINHLMDGLAKSRVTEEETISIIDSLPFPVPMWATFLKEILKQDPDKRQEYIESKLSPEVSCDEILIGFAYLVRSNPDIFNKTFIENTDDYMDKIRIFGDKLPILYDIAAQRMWMRYLQHSDNSDKYLEHALECMYHADKAGFLSKDNMTNILTYCEEHGKDNKILFSDEDLVRFDKICPKEYRDRTNSFGMEIEESPVELIEE